MRDIIIKVDQDKADDSIMIGVSGALFTMDNFLDKNSLHFWLTKEKADQLAHYIQSTLQDMEKVAEEKIEDLENQKLKYGGEDTYYGEDR